MVDDDVVDSITIVFSSSSEVLDVQEEIKKQLDDLISFIEKRKEL